MENNNVKCESWQQQRNEDTNELDPSSLHHHHPAAAATAAEDVHHVMDCGTGYRVKSEGSYKCEILKCEQCAKDAAGQLSCTEIDKDSGILEDDAGSAKLDIDTTDVKEELGTLVSHTN